MIIEPAIFNEEKRTDYWVSIFSCMKVFYFFWQEKYVTGIYFLPWRGEEALADISWVKLFILNEHLFFYWPYERLKEYWKWDYHSSRPFPFSLPVIIMVIIITRLKTVPLMIHHFCDGEPIFSLLQQVQGQLSFKWEDEEEGEGKKGIFLLYQTISDRRKDQCSMMMTTRKTEKGLYSEKHFTERHTWGNVITAVHPCKDLFSHFERWFATPKWGKMTGEKTTDLGTHNFLSMEILSLFPGSNRARGREADK